MPYRLVQSAMAQSPDGGGVLIFGGINYSDYVIEKSILEMRAGANSWTILDIKLKYGRKSHVVIPLK